MPSDGAYDSDLSTDQDHHLIDPQMVLIATNGIFLYTSRHRSRGGGGDKLEALPLHSYFLGLWMGYGNVGFAAAR